MVLSGIFGYLIGGAVIGILARFLKPGADPMGWILTIVLGIAGAFVGSWISTTLGIASGWLKWVVAIAAAVVLLFIYEALRKKKS
ncbi:GlsB/YeaQ/YmgE family stress response membrane protein [Pseudoxanthomonas sangjuensis]|uniref:GlsB/YeaQ/YmgE family stress response membrane protein n=1 Tax=Pseudoxanthomonas sangjuensis TaxID=1503750 RepID=UPI001391AB43|nr:GlsB/YeaQ/YmgE family stress response membrane protein [Pseudoxanthomonas sangjuensis]KAF1713183.1 GlsB/YeaQ/YmgE family stress response membrane protein [Pseudoxanthomonas sangjuensis]